MPCNSSNKNITLKYFHNFKDERCRQSAPIYCIKFEAFKIKIQVLQQQSVCG